MIYPQRAALAIVAITLIGQSIAVAEPASIRGTWRPYSETARFIGAITVSPGAIVFEQSGSLLSISAVDGQPGVYMLPDALAPDVRKRIGCGPLALAYLTLYAGADGILNMKVYDEDRMPTVPSEANRLAIIGGGCALYNFSR